jgi:hypothetical protein
MGAARATEELRPCSLFVLDATLLTGSGHVKTEKGLIVLFAAGSQKGRIPDLDMRTPCLPA